MTEDCLEYYAALWQIAETLCKQAGAEAIGRCLDVMRTAVNAQGAAAHLLCKEDDRLHVAAAVGLMAEKYDNASLAKDEGIEGDVFSKQESRVVDDLASDEVFAGRYSLSDVYQIRTLLCVPIRRGDTCVGCVNLLNKSGDAHFSQEDRKLAEGFAMMLGQGLAQAAPIPLTEQKKPVVVLNKLTVQDEAPQGGEVIANLDLTLCRGQILAISGLSARQERALFSVLAGMRAPAGGTMRIAGETAAFEKAAMQTYRRNTCGVVCKEAELLEYLTVEKNLQVCARHAAAPISVQETMRLAGLDSVCAAQYPRQLNEEQMMRALLARALVKHPEFLLVRLSNIQTDGLLIDLLRKLCDSSGLSAIVLGGNKSAFQKADCVWAAVEGMVTGVIYNSFCKGDPA